jgi:hypothetical protein
MGGLVVQLAEQQCGDHFDKVVFAATPFKGAPGLFYDLFTGNKVRANTALMNAPALWTFPAVWQMLPRTNDFFVDPQSQPTTLALEAAETWKGWPMPCPERLEERLADRARMPVEFPAPRARTMTVIGRGKKSCSAVRLNPATGIDFTEAKYSDGDGAVPLESARPPFESQLVFTGFGHAAVLDDPKVRSAIARFLKTR